MAILKKKKNNMHRFFFPKHHSHYECSGMYIQITSDSKDTHSPLCDDLYPFKRWRESESERRGEDGVASHSVCQ